MGMPGVAFIGNNGTLVIDRGTWDVYPEEEDGKFLMSSIPSQKSKSNGVDHHTLNFLECIKSRKQPNCTIEMGRNAALNAQLGNISHRLKNKVFWNEKANSFINDAKAGEMAKSHYRAPWKLPKV